MAESPNFDARTRRVIEIFDELRKQQKPDQEIFAEAAVALKQLARKMTAGQPAGASMHASGLLNDVYIKLFERPSSDFQWETGEEFFVAVAEAMRNLRSDYFRRKRAKKRGGGTLGSLDKLREEGVEAFTELGAPVPPIHKNLFEEKCLHAEMIDQAMRRLWREFPERAKAIVLTEVDGMTYKEVAQILKTNPEKVHNDLRKGRARLQHYQNS
jgi:RNA polymerase sigma factor (sigma-70 family)